MDISSIFNFGNNRIKYSQNEYLKYIGLTLFFLILMGLFGLEVKQYHFISNMKWFLCISLILGGAVGYLFSKKYILFAKDLTDRVQTYIFFMLTAMVFTPVVVSISNRLLPALNTEIVTAQLAAEEVFVAERFGKIKGEESQTFKYKTDLFLNENVLTFYSDQPLFHDKSPGDQVEIQLKQGIWGVKYYDVNEDNL